MQGLSFGPIFTSQTQWMEREIQLAWVEKESLNGQNQKLACGMVSSNRAVHGNSGVSFPCLA